MNSDGMFDILTIFRIIIRKLWLIILVTAVCTGSVAYLNIRSDKPVYEAKASLYVVTRYYSNNELQPQTYDDIMVNQQMLKDSTELIKSNKVTTAVIEELGITDITPEGLAGKINISLKKDTSILQVTVRDSIPLRAKDIVNTVSKVFIDKMRTLTNQDNISIVDAAQMPISPIATKRNINILVAFLASIMGTIGLILFFEYIDNTVKTVDDVENKLGYNVIGIIPKMNIK